MGQLNEPAKFVEGLQHALDDPVDALADLRDWLSLLKYRVNNGHSLVDLELEINELISKAHKQAPRIPEEFIKGLLGLI